MDLAQLANLGEFIGGVAVLVTLVYLASQIRHSTRVALTSNHAAMMGDLRSIYRAVAQDASLAELVVRGERDFESLQEVDQRRFLEFANLLFGIWEQAHLCHLNGTIDEYTWTTWDEFGQHKLAPSGYSTVWPQFKSEYFATFRLHLEGTLFSSKGA